MKVFRRLPAALLALILILCTASVNPLAAETTEDGLKLTLTTDQTSYEEGEDIEANLTVENTGSRTVSDVHMEYLIPGGYELSPESVKNRDVDSLEAGKSASLGIVLTRGKAASAGNDETGTKEEEEEEQEDIQNKEDEKEDDKKTEKQDPAKSGDESHGLLWGIIFLASGLVILLIVFLSSETGKRLLSTFLSLLMILLLVCTPAEPARAANLERRALTVHQKVTADGKELMITAVVKYSAVSQEPAREVKTYTVRFETNGGSAVESQKVAEGTCVSRPKDPARNGYAFQGWFKDQQLAAAFDFSVPVKGDLTVYAKWKQQSQNRDDNRREDQGGNQDDDRQDDQSGNRDDNLNDDQIDLGDVQTRIDNGTIDVIFDKNGKISTIDGPVTDKKIQSSSDAADLLASMSPIIDTDLSVSEENIKTASIGDEEKFYRYLPEVNGLEVLGSQVIVATDSQGSVTGVFNSYKEDVNNINTTPSISEDEAQEAAENALLEEDEIRDFLDSSEGQGLSRSELNAAFLNLQSVSSYLAVYAGSDLVSPSLVYVVNIETRIPQYEDMADEDLPAEEEERESSSEDTSQEQTDPPAETEDTVEYMTETPADGDTAEELENTEDAGAESWEDTSGTEETSEETAEETGDEDEEAQQTETEEETSEVTTEETSEETTEEIPEETEEEEYEYEFPPLVSETFMIYANGASAGEILSAVHNHCSWENVTVKAKDLNDVEREFSAQTEGDRVRLVDSARDITTYEAEDYLVVDGPWWDPNSYREVHGLPGRVISSHFVLFMGEAIRKDAVSAHYNMERVYDYYKNVLGRDSFDGNGAAIRVSIHFGTLIKNAFWDSYYQQMLYGSIGNLEAGLDVAGHEFTHAVIDYVVSDGTNVSLTYSDESGSLNEAYADIMGELIESKEGADDWLLGEDTSNAIRSMKEPSKHNQPEHYRDRYIGNDEDYEVHTNSGIFNFAAYKMMTDSRTSTVSREEWAEIFYRSLFRLTPDADFLAARGAVICSAKARGFNHEQQEAIKDAFDAVGITEPGSVRIVLKWGETPRDLDSHLTGPTVDGTGRFHIYFADRTYYNNNARNELSSDYSIYAADLDYDDTTSYGPEITTIHTLTPGEYYFYVHDYTNRDTEDCREMAGSGAVVEVYIGTDDRAAATCNVSESSSGIYWNVFKLTIDDHGGVEIDEIDSYGNSAAYE